MRRYQAGQITIFSKNIQLKKELSELLESTPIEKWVSDPDLEKTKKKLSDSAKITLRKDAKINIRLSSADLKAIKLKAAEDGLGYQTLISSVLHKFAVGE